MQTKTAAAYARFSSDNQRAESIDAQFADIDRYAERMGYTVVARYADEAKSATTDRRPEFQRMISDAETGAFAAVLVFKLDRFSRDRYDFAFYRRKLARSGVKIVSINENLSIRTTTTRNSTHNFAPDTKKYPSIMTGVFFID